jgi:catechol 2,3-dioxygenase-like lactoylglutathione lyase family enzyme
MGALSWKGLHHVAIFTRDMEESLRFYGEVLGFKVTERFYDEGEKADIAFLDLGNTLLEIIAPSDDEWSHSSSFHIALQVEDASKTFAALRAKGIPVVLSLTETHGFRYAYFAGPMQETLEIVEPPKKP